MPLWDWRLGFGRVAEKATRKAWSWARDWVSQLVRQSVAERVSWMVKRWVAVKARKRG